MKFNLFLITSLIAVLFGFTIGLAKDLNKKLDGIIGNQNMLIDCMIFNRCKNDIPPFMRPPEEKK